MGRLGSIAVSAALAFGLAGFADSAFAQGELCDHLESQLIALDSNPGSASDFAKYQKADSAVHRQRRELDQASDEARRAGCLGGFFAQFKKSGSCGRVMANVNRMRANLDRLTRARDRYSPDPFDDSRERAELVAALGQNGCGPQYETFERPSRRPGIFAKFFGGPVFREPGWGDPFFGGDFGTYRTLCVRTCDGYYFPISFSTSQSHFAADEATCQAQCPGTEVALYVHHSPGEESDAMVSLSGEPYSALPAAFRYRQTYDKSCTCGKVAAGQPQMTPIQAEAVRSGPDPWGFARAPDDPIEGDPPVPLAPPSAEDPETVANRAGSFQPETAAAPAPAAVAEFKPAGERTVRIVGPTFYYGQ